HTRSDRDWSSDVCSSDLASPEREIFGSLMSWSASFAILTAIGFATGRLAEFPRSLLAWWLVCTPLLTVASHTILRQVCQALWARSEERRVGKECRCRWAW